MPRCSGGHRGRGAAAKGLQGQQELHLLMAIMQREEAEIALVCGRQRRADKDQHTQADEERERTDRLKGPFHSTRPVPG